MTSRFAVAWLMAALVAIARAPAAKGYNILAVQPVGGLGHWLVMEGVLRAMVELGRHNVTVFTPFRGSENATNYTVMDISDAFPVGVNVPLAALQSNFSHPKAAYDKLAEIGRAQCDSVFKHPTIARELLRRDVYDAVVIEPLWSDCTSYMAAAMRLPLVYTSAFAAISFRERTIAGLMTNPLVYGNLLLPRLVPSTANLRHLNMELQVRDSWAMLVDRVAHVVDPKPYELARRTVPPSAVFLNTHRLLERARPVDENVIHVAGVHLQDPKPLPEDIEEFINNSPNGVIYMSFGSTLKMSTIPRKIFFDTILSALNDVPMNVLFKYEEDFIPIGTNMMARKWFPQRDVLVHPNVKVFVSNGGICGIHEALDSGIPVVGVPMLGDQPRNIDSLINLGMAVRVDFDKMNKTDFYKQVMKVVVNKTFTENAKKASDIFKQQLPEIKENVVKWTELAIQGGMRLDNTDDSLLTIWGDQQLVP